MLQHVYRLYAAACCEMDSVKKSIDCMAETDSTKEEREDVTDHPGCNSISEFICCISMEVEVRKVKERDGNGKY